MSFNAERRTPNAERVLSVTSANRLRSWCRNDDTSLATYLLPDLTLIRTLLPMPAPLVISGLSKHYPAADGSVPVLDNLNLTVEPGQTVAILGPSGSGKSTLLAIIASLEMPSAGSVRLGEVEVTTLCGQQLQAFRACGVGMVFQDHHLLPQLTAEENVLIPALAMDRVAKAQPQADELFKVLDLADKRRRFPAQLSGGERQRVAVARALINQPALLLCDEPTGNLDPRHAASVVALITDLSRRLGTTVIMVTHHRALVAGFDRTLELSGGQLHLTHANDFPSHAQGLTTITSALK